MPVVLLLMFCAVVDLKSFFEHPVAQMKLADNCISFLTNELDATEFMCPQKNENSLTGTFPHASAVTLTTFLMWALSHWHIHSNEHCLTDTFLLDTPTCTHSNTHAAPKWQNFPKPPLRVGGNVHVCCHEKILCWLVATVAHHHEPAVSIPLTQKSMQTSQESPLLESPRATSRIPARTCTAPGWWTQLRKWRQAGFTAIETTKPKPDHCRTALSSYVAPGHCISSCYGASALKAKCDLVSLSGVCT